MPSNSTRSRTETEPGASAVAILRELLGEDRIQREVDEPLDQAAQSLRLQVSSPASTEAFRDCMATAIQHLYEHGLRCPRKLSRQAALAEAVDLIRRGYPGRPEDRLDTALLEATSGQGGDIQDVVGFLVETIRGRERRQYIDWVFAVNADPLDWKGHLAAARELLEGDLRGDLPGDFEEHDFVTLSREFRELFFLCRNVGVHLRQTLTGRQPPTGI